MAKKAEIQNLINTNIASGSDIKAVDHRAVLTDVLDNFYGLKTFDYDRTSGTTSNILTTSSNLTYEVDITKNGTRVNLTGTIVNNSGVLLPNSTSVFEITNSDYLMQDTNANGTFTYSVLTKGIVINNDDVSLQLINNTLRILEPTPRNLSIKFSITYNTQD